jgi:zinc transport system substrate-binding protein
MKSKPIVLVSISPYDTIVKEIVGEYAEVKLVVPPGYNSHAFEPSPSEFSSWDRAQIFFGIGDRYEQKIYQTILKKNPGFLYVNLNASLPGLIKETDHHHHSDHDHNDDDFSYDVHVWMDPIMMIEQAKIICDRLSQLFPSYAKNWKSNLGELTHRLLHLNQDIASILLPYKNDSLLVSHASLGYFCKRYLLVQLSLEVEGKDPLPQDVKKVLEQCKNKPPRCAFIQEGQNNKGVLIVAQKLEIPVHTLAPNAPDYEESLLSLAHMIAGDA